MNAAQHTRPAARHASGRTRSIWPSVVRKVGIAALVLVISAGSIGSIAIWRLTRTIGQIAVPLDPKQSIPTIGALNGAFNVLLVGADNSSGQSGFGASRDATLNDVNILVHVAADHRSGTVVSLPRDLVIPHPECTDPKTGTVAPALSADLLNVDYERGGLGCVVSTVESLTGLNIPYAAKFTFEGTVKMADAVGGVPVCVTKAINDPHSGLKLKKGVTVIKGRTALAYLRERKYLGDGSDLSRIQSQQAYMSALLRKMTSAGTLSNPAQLYTLAAATTQNVTLSQSMAGLDTLVQMALALKAINLNDMVFVQYPTVADPADPDRVVPNAAIATTLVDRVQRDKSINLDKDALAGVKASKSPTESSTSSPTVSQSTSPVSGSSVIPGLKGRTATQQTCSVPNRDS